MTYTKWNVSPREHQVAMLVGRGLPNKEIARELGLSVGTVKLHVHNILQKIGARNRSEVVLLAANDASLGPADCSSTKGNREA
jgi:DNA-binding NarL/FixJ family response regulator